MEKNQILWNNYKTKWSKHNHLFRNLNIFWAQILLRKTFNSDSYIMLEIKDLDTNIQETKWEPNQDDRIGQVSIPRTGKNWTRFEQVF